MEDALSATRAAYEEGVISGGGVALLKSALGAKFSPKYAGANESEYKAGYAILVKALEEPLRQIVANGGQKDPGVVLNEIITNKNINYGFDAAKGEYVTDMIKAGIIDPLKVTRTALENAVSVAAILLTTEVAITDQPEEKCKCGSGGGAGMPGGMGGMM